MPINYTAGEIIYAAARRAGVLGAPGRKLSDSESADCLDALNTLLDGWNIDPLKIYSQVINAFTLVAGQQIYTIGQDPAGILTPDFDVPRPDEITHANIITQISGGQPVRTPMALLNDDGWSAIQVQAVGSSIPLNLYNDGAYPLSNLYFYPYPNGPAQVELYMWNPADQFSNLTDNFLMPPGYRRAVEYNLAVDIATMFRKFPINPLVMRVAMESRKAVDDHNAPEPVMSCDIALQSPKKSTWNYLTGLPN